MEKNGAELPVGRGAGPASGARSGRRDGRRRRRLVWLAVCAVGGILVSLAFSRSLFGQPAGAGPGRNATPHAIPVVGSAARLGDLEVYQSGLGTVTPLKAVTVRSRVDGELVEVSFREGQAVHEGELLARIDSRPFEVQLLQAQGQIGKDEAALRNARVDLDRYQVLISQDSISRQQVDTQAATVSQFEAAIKSDQAQIESAKLNLTYCRITAPVSGVVGLRLVDRGNIVHASDASGIVVITQQRPIAVVFTLPSDKLPGVLRQLRAGRTLRVEAWDRDLRHELATGTVLALDNEIDPTTGTVRVKAMFPNDDGALYPNQFVNARLLDDTLRGVVIVPTAALERGPKSTFVYVVGRDSTVQVREVEVAATEADDTAIRRGLASGEVVVVDGLDRLQPGAAVAVAKEGSGPKART